MSIASFESALRLSKSNIIDTTTFSQKLLKFFYLLPCHRSSEVPSVSWYILLISLFDTRGSNSIKNGGKRRFPEVLKYISHNNFTACYLELY